MGSWAPGAARTGDADSGADAWEVYRVAHLDALKVHTATAMAQNVPAVNCVLACKRGLKESGETAPKVVVDPLQCSRRAWNSHHHTLMAESMLACMQESDPAPEGDSPVNAKAARIEHTLSALDKLPDSFKGALALP